MNSRSPSFTCMPIYKRRRTRASCCSSILKTLVCGKRGTPSPLKFWYTGEAASSCLPSCGLALFAGHGQGQLTLGMQEVHSACACLCCLRPRTIPGIDLIFWAQRTMACCSCMQEHAGDLVARTSFGSSSWGQWPRSSTFTMAGLKDASCCVLPLASFSGSRPPCRVCWSMTRAYMIREKAAMIHAQKACRHPTRHAKLSKSNLLH